MLMMKKLQEGACPIVLICMLSLAICTFSSMAPAGASPVIADESAILGGSTCSDFMDGAAVGMGIGVLFGCVWCGAGAVLAKAISLFC